MRSSLLAALCALVLPLCAWADIQQLLNSDELRVRSWLGGEPPFTARNMLPLYIEVASARQFAKGSRVLRLEIPGTVVLQRERFAVNSTRYEDGRQWAVQLWTVALYPQQSGELFVPAQRLEVSIASDDGVLAGMLTLPALQAAVQWPEGLNGESEWVAAPALTLTQTLDRDTSGLQQGDVVRRVINIEAEDVAAMMLPGYQASAQQGLAVYQKSPRLSDSSNRGIYRAQRREVISYVLEREGRYELPPVSVRWWDSRNGEVREEVLPALVLSAAAASASESGATAQRWRVLGAAAVLALLAAALWLAWRRWRQQPLRRLQRDLHKACQADDPAAALALFYRWLDLVAPTDYRASVRQWLQADNERALFEQIMAAYARVPAPDTGALLQLLDHIQNPHVLPEDGAPACLRLN